MRALGKLLSDSTSSTQLAKTTKCPYSQTIIKFNPTTHEKNKTIN